MEYVLTEMFDTPVVARKKRQTKPLLFKVGLGRVIRGVRSLILPQHNSPTLTNSLSLPVNVNQ